MKHIPLITAIIILGATISLNAQTSTILIKTGDAITGTSSNSAVLLSLGNVTMNDIGGIALQGYATETNRSTNEITITNFGYITNYVPCTNYALTTNMVNFTNYTYETNMVPWTNYTYATNLVTYTNYTYETNMAPWTNYTYATNLVTYTNYNYETNMVSYTNTTVERMTNVVTQTNQSVTYQYTSVITTNVVINNYNGIITNTLYTTNIFNVNGSTNAYVNKIAQTQISTNSRVTFTNTYNTPQGGHSVTNTYTTNVTQYSYQTNSTVTNRPVVTSTPYLTNRPVVTTTPYLTNRPVVTTTPYLTNRPVVTITPYLTNRPVVTTTPYLTNRPVVTTTPYLTNRPVLTWTNFVTLTNRVSVTTLNYSGIWATDTNDSINLMIRSGQPIGTSNSIITWFTAPVINNNGAIAFIGYSLTTNSVMNTNGTSSNIVSSAGTIYLALQGSTNLINVASVGAAAPGTSGVFTSFSNLALPDVGGVIFVGMVGTNQGVWVQNSDLTVQLVALKGQSINVDGTNKVISNFNLINYGYPGVTHSYSQDTGTITYQAYFTDGTSAAIRVNR